MNTLDRTWQVMIVIYNYYDEHLVTPTIRYIADKLDISTSQVSLHLRKLEADGYIEIMPRKANGIRIIKPRVGGSILGRMAQIPFLGIIAAGEPLSIPDSDTPIDMSSDNCIFVDRSQLPRGDLNGVYALRVKGKSMIDALIDDGDIVIIRYQQNAENGETVVARIKDENTTTLKDFYNKGKEIELRPANPDFGPIQKPSDQVEIQGKVLLIIRQPNGGIPKDL